MSASEPAARKATAPVIWVIESNPDHREVLSEVLAQAVSGASVVASGTGQEEIPELAERASLIVAGVETPADLLAPVAAWASPAGRPFLLLTRDGGEGSPAELDRHFPVAAVLEKTDGAAFVAALESKARELLSARDPSTVSADAPVVDLPVPDLRPLGRRLIRHLRESLEMAAEVGFHSPGGAPTGAAVAEAGLERARALAVELDDLLANGDEAASRVINLMYLLRVREPLWSEWTGGRLRLEWETVEDLDWRVDLPPDLFAPILDRVLIDAWRRGGPERALRLVLEDASRGRLRLVVGSGGGSATAVLPPAEPAALGPLRAVARCLGGSAARLDSGSVELLLPRHPGAAEGSSSPSVLVVDDDATLRRIAADCVERAGARPCVAECGEQAVELHEAGCRYEMVLLDLNLGKLDGLATARQLRRIHPRAQIILCSARGQERLAAAAAAGVTGLVAKPFGAAELTAVVRGLLGLPPFNEPPPPGTGRSVG